MLAKHNVRASGMSNGVKRWVQSKREGVEMKTWGLGCLNFAGLICDMVLVLGL